MAARTVRILLTLLDMNKDLSILASYFLHKAADFRCRNVALLPCQARNCRLLNDFDEANL
jgi:hypothetical protein